MKYRKILKEIIPIVQLCLSIVTLYRLSLTTEYLSNIISKNFYRLSNELNNVKDKFFVFSQKLEIYEGNNANINNLLTSLDHKTEKILIDQIEKMNSLTAYLAKIDSKIVNLELDINKFPEILRMFDHRIIPYQEQSSNFLYNGMYYGGVFIITISFIAICYLYLPSISSYFSEIKSGLLEVVSRLPGSNTAEGIQRITSLGLNIKTNVIHGKAHSIYIDVSSGMEYSNFIDFLKGIGYTVTNPETIELTTSVITTCGKNVTGLI